MNASNARREALIFFLIAVSGAFAAIFFAPSALKLFGFANMTIQEILAQPEESAGRSLLLYQAIGATLMFLVPGLFIINRWKQNNSINLLTKQKWGVIQTVLALSLLPLLLPLMDWLSNLWSDWGHQSPILKALFDEYDANSLLIEKMIFFNSLGDSLFSVFVFVILAATSEELFFRGAIQRLLHNNLKPYQAIILGAMAFAIGHLNLVQLPFLIIAGTALAFIYWISGRLWVSISAHILHNGLTYFWTVSSGPGSYGEMSRQTSNIWQVLIFTAVAIIIAIQLNQLRKSAK